MSTAALPVSISDVIVTTCVLPSIAIIVTSFRLFDRLRRSKFWWDDGWALASLVLTIIFMVAVLLHIKGTNLQSDVKIGVYYMCALFFYAVVWSARVSILFTVIRICPTGRLRTFLGYVVLATGITWIILFAQVFWVCQKEPGWKDQPIPQCFLGRNVAIAQVITDVVMDAILILTPLRLIWGVTLLKARKVQLMAVFSTTLASTAVSLYHAFEILRKGGLFEALAATIETSVSLVVANLTVIAAFLFRINNGESEVNNREPVYLNTMSRKRRTRADPLHTLSTFDESMTLGNTTILTNMGTSHFVGNASKTEEGAKEILIKAKSTSNFTDRDSVETFEMKVHSEGNESSTVFSKS